MISRCYMDAEMTKLYYWFILVHNWSYTKFRLNAKKEAD